LDNNFNNLKDVVTNNSQILNDYEYNKESFSELNKELKNFAIKSELIEFKKNIKSDISRVDEQINYLSKNMSSFNENQSKLKLNIDTRFDNFESFNENQQILIKSIS